MRRCPFYALAEGAPQVICTLHHGIVDGALEEAGSEQIGRAARPVRRAGPLHRPSRAAALDRLRRAGEPGAPAFEAHAEVAAREVDEHLARAVRRRRDRDSARAGRGRSPPPRAPRLERSPHRDRRQRATWTFVRSGKRGSFSRSGPSSPIRAGSPSTTACGLPTETGVSSTPATTSGGETSTTPRSPTRVAVADPRAPRRRGHRRGLARRRIPSAAHQPRRRDARAVARHLRVRAVGIEDPDRHLVAVDGEHLDDAVRPLGVGRRRRPVMDEVDVPVRVPARRFQRRSPPEDGRQRP